MKLKFEAEIQDVIDTLAVFPDTSTEENLATTSVILGIISKLDADLLRKRKANEISMKYWVKLRRQLSFLYELIWISDKCTKEKSPSDPVKYTYKVLMKAIRTIKNGEVMQEPTFVKIALKYGILFLSDQEIATLITNNRV